MDIVKRFDQIRNTKTVAISELELHVEYEIKAMTRISTKLRQSIILTLQKNSEHHVRVYLTCRYVSVFSDGRTRVEQYCYSLC
jgi:hypothetical protein